MGKTRVKVISAVAVGASALFALTAPAASAAMPKVLNANAGSQALKVTLKVPSIPQLRAALIAAGLPVDAVPAVDVSPLATQVIDVARNGAAATKSAGTMHSEGFADPIGGSIKSQNAQSSCNDAACDNATNIVAQRIDLPNDLGYVDIAGATSVNPTHLRSAQKTAAVDVNLSLESVLNKELAAVAGVLDTLRTSLNTTVVPQLNSAIDTVKTTVDGVDALLPVKRELDRIITVDHVKPIPDLSEVDLVTGRVLGGIAKVTDETRNGMTGLAAHSESEIVNLSLLGGWATIGSIRVEADAFANSVKGAAGSDANSVTDIANVDLGGLLGVHISADDLIRLTESETLKAVARDTMKELGVNQDLTNIENAIELVYDTSGISVVKLSNTEKVSPAGILAEAAANSLLIKIEPKLPNFNKLREGLAGGSVPLLANSDYIPTGLSLTVELPTATAWVQATSVKSVCVGSCVPITGVGTPWLLAIALIGMAIAVRKFALAR